MPIGTKHPHKMGRKVLAREPPISSDYTVVVPSIDFIAVRLCTSAPLKGEEAKPVKCDPQDMWTQFHKIMRNCEKAVSHL